jgi:hypothetical protein
MLSLTEQDCRSTVAGTTIGVTRFLASLGFLLNPVDIRVSNGLGTQAALLRA